MGCWLFASSFCRQQVTEIIFVLKAVSTLIDSLKKTQPENGKLLLNNVFLNEVKLYLPQSCIYSLL